MNDSVYMKVQEMSKYIAIASTNGNDNETNKL